jgi:hypothetical protein
MTADALRAEIAACARMAEATGAVEPLVYIAGLSRALEIIEQTAIVAAPPSRVMAGAAASKPPGKPAPAATAGTRPREYAGRAWTPERVEALRRDYATAELSKLEAKINAMPGHPVAGRHALLLKASKLGLRRGAGPSANAPTTHGDGDGAHRAVFTPEQLAEATGLIGTSWDDEATSDEIAEAMVDIRSKGWRAKEVAEFYGFAIGRAQAMCAMADRERAAAARAA